MFQSLRARFVSLLFFGMTLAILAISVLVFQYRAQISHTERLGQAAEIGAALDGLFAHVLQASNTSRRFVLSGAPAQLEAYQTAVDAVPGALSEIEAITGNQPEFADEFETLKARLDNKLAHLDAILELHANDELAEMRMLLISSDGLERLEALRTSVAAFSSIGYGLADGQLEQFRIGLLVQVAVVVLMVFCGAVWAAILGNEAIRNILVPVSSMNAQIKRIAAGDFRDMLPVARRDEIGGLAEQINLMTTQLSTARDEREQAQTELATERQNLIDALEALDEGFAAYDSQGRLLRSNQKFLDYYPAIAPLAKPGVTYETLLRRKAESGAEPIAIGQEEEFVQERLAEIHEANTVRECKLSDGRVLQRSSYRTSFGGRVAVYVDITGIKRAEARLLELNRELDARVRDRTEDLNYANTQLQLLNAELGAIIVSAPVAIVALSPERKVMIWNPAAIELTGLEKDAVEAGLTNLVDEENARDLEQFLDQVYNDDGPQNAELHLRHQSGKRIEANVSASVLSDDQDQPVGAILIISDLTESRELQHQFQQSQKMEVVAELTAGLAHDFNNLLAIVISNIELLEGQIPQDDPAQKLIGSAKRASLSGVALNRKLLAFSRDHTLELEGLDLSKELAFLDSLLQVTLGEGVRLNISLDADLWPVTADRSLLQSAVLNLAVNARDAMDGNGQFSVSAMNRARGSGDDLGTLEGDFVEITVADTGSGMSEEVISRAFEPFYSTKGFGKSSGLGLSMVYGFVKQSGGDIRIASEIGSGTQIIMLLPRGSVVAQTQDKMRDGSDRTQGDGENILLVEDNTEMRRAMALQLAKLGFNPIQADGGITALELLEAEVPIDLMLTDIVMPGGMNGRELASKARSIREDLPIVFMSGYPGTDEDTANPSSDLGIKMLAKPIGQSELGVQINAALSKGSITESA